MITVLVVDDNAVVRATLRPLLEAEPGIAVVGEAADGRSGLAEARRLRPQVTLLDQRMPGADGLSVVEEIAQHSNVLVLTGSAEPGLVAPMLRGGARGYLVYGEFDPPELTAAVRAVAAGEGWLAPRQASVATTMVRDAHARERARAARTGDLRAAREQFGLSEREREVIALVCDGLPNGAIGTRLGVSEKTVKNHLNSVFAKLDVTNRTGAVVRWLGRR